MDEAEVEAFLDTRRFAAVATVGEDGSPRVVPARYRRSGTIVHLAPSAPGPHSTPMSREEAERFLVEYRYPNERATPPFITVATLKKDGSAHVVPFGYTFEDGAFTLSINNARMLHRRLRRDPRVAIAVFGDEEPLRAVVVRGVAETVEDPGGQLSRAVFRRHMEPYPWLDFEAYLSQWLAAGRTVYRVRPQDLSGWTSEEGDAPARLDAREDDPPVSFAAFSDEAPTVVALLLGHARRSDAGGYDLEVERRAAWDSRKQPPVRWEKGQGSHVEGGTWIDVGSG
jgi:nitroimidazol reductase NimA-like FMN-containing flavoprotein (pyridoxamine 5'-phosphate oxidase superfamily)